MSERNVSESNTKLKGLVKTTETVDMSRVKKLEFTPEGITVEEGSAAFALKTQIDAFKDVEKSPISFDEGKNLVFRNFTSTKAASDFSTLLSEFFIFRQSVLESVKKYTKDDSVQIEWLNWNGDLVRPLENFGGYEMRAYVKRSN